MPQTKTAPGVVLLADGDEKGRGAEPRANHFLGTDRKEELLTRVKSLVRLTPMGDRPETAENILFDLARSIEAKDLYTAGHCERVSRYAAGLAEQLGLPEEQRLALRRGGLVHDIGKVAIPDHILHKRGPLDAEERLLVESHTIVGEQICAPLESFRNVLPIIRSHHERQDGSGYPDRLMGEQIPVTARVLQIVDIYDALTSDRPYRAALTREQALDTIREEAMRGWWDASLIPELESLLKKRPTVRSLNRLADDSGSAPAGTRRRTA